MTGAFLVLFLLGAGLTEEGHRLLLKAERGATSEQRVADLLAAAKEFRAVVQAQPDHYVARGLLAQTLFGLLRETGELRYSVEARQQFAAAAALPDADWRIFNAYGRFLLYIGVPGEAQPLFEKAFGLARWSTERSAVNLLYGQCLHQLALETADAADRRRYLEQSVERLSAATQELPGATDAGALRVLGLALLELGRPREALAALDDAGHTADTQYARARAHAWLDEPEPALARLRQSLEAGSATNLVALAQRDPAFERLRDRQDFRQLLAGFQSVESVEALLREGLDLSAQADAATVMPARVELLKRAADRFRRAAELQTGAATAQMFCAQTLARLAELATTTADRQTFAAEAAERFAAATKLPGANWQTYHIWGIVLEFLAETEPDRLGEATEKFETGLKLATGTAERRQLQRELAGNLVNRAANLPAAQATGLLERAIQLCGELPPQPEVNAIWGRALILSGKAGGGRMRFRQAAEKLSAALSAAPANPELHYRLAVAYSLLDSKPQAMLHLRSCLKNDPTGAYGLRAQQDPDLAAVRSLPEFYELFER